MNSFREINDKRSAVLSCYLWSEENFHQLCWALYQLKSSKDTVFCCLKFHMLSKDNNLSFLLL